ncbi:prepilin peptidase [Streptomyces fulvorobeus]|uniref:Prepilin peptidase n=1 Tax=Streptomyces fulvorobeus TaxID=284028 RepID=A0A7J0CB35_9ACTN|nr:A24 family peptidase [Streptomyces fulvorobeus]NYE42683.1 leader peptidase (prepilin peptidase)/N-methyltransferase [Streptomyces fulvorobeus]GFM99093.1 prepilin peptidase [Streptomyces fulvorobeus]
MDAILIAVAALWGVATGLLVPRAAYRFSVQPDEDRRDACPAGHPLTGPARGWLGSTRCARCAVAVPSLPGAPGRDGTATAQRPARAPEPAPAHAPTAPRYAPAALPPVVTALACTVLAAATGPRPELAVWLLLTPVAVLLAVIDRRVHRLPDRLTLPLAAAAVLLLGAVSLAPGRTGSWTSAVLGGLALGGFYFLLFLVNPDGMGFGDVKLALSLGVVLGWYGWAVLFAGGFAGFLLGAVYGLGLMLLRGAGRRTGIPFGPFMIAGALLGVLFGALAA